MSEGHGDHVTANREAWNRNAPEYVEPGRRAWALEEPEWGIWHVPEATVGMLPDDLHGADAVELGCGAGYVSAWLARRGARPVGLDNSPEQLKSARHFQEEFHLSYPLVHADAERAPLDGGRFDFAISEYGASIWCDPYRWIPEAARLLRAGGQLAFLANSVVLMLCVPDDEGLPAGEALLRPQAGIHRFEWPPDPAVEFHISHGDMVRLLRGCGFEVEDLIEIYPPEDASTRYPFVTLDWSRKWPCEEVWKARKVR